MIAVEILTAEYEQFVQKCQAIDLTPLMDSLKRSLSDSSQSYQNSQKTISHYFAFLYLIDRHPCVHLILPVEIDRIWRAHCLNCKKYAEDCHFLFGHFIFYVPSIAFEDLPEADRLSWLRSYALTQVLLRKYCGIESVLHAAIPSGIS